MQNTIQFKLMNQINNLEQAKSNIEVQIRCLTQDLGYQSISRFTYNARKKQLEDAKSNINNTISFLEDFYRKAERVDFHELTGTQKTSKAN